MFLARDERVKILETAQRANSKTFLRGLNMKQLNHLLFHTSFVPQRSYFILVTDLKQRWRTCHTQNVVAHYNSKLRSIYLLKEMLSSRHTTQFVVKRISAFRRKTGMNSISNKIIISICELVLDTFHPFYFLTGDPGKSERFNSMRT